MKQKTGFILVAAALTCMAAGRAMALTLAAGGKSAYTIILPDKAPASVKDAAAELQRDIALSTGARLPIHTDGEKVEGPIISLGTTRQAQAAGITSNDVADCGFRIVIKENDLYILGPDTAATVNLHRKNYGDIKPHPDIPGPQYTRNGGFSNGTANGVYTFLEDYLDVRWLMPGDIGRDVPPRAVFQISDIDHTEAPLFIYRRLSILEWGARPSGSVEQWRFRQKLGFSFRLNSSHNWSRTVPSNMFKERPDWFAMIDGKRMPPAKEYPQSRRYKLETTNPELIRYFAQQAIKAFKSDPHQNTFSLSPSDGRGWSESPASKALYDPPPPGEHFPSMSRLMFKFYRDVSRIVAREYPEGKLAGYLYADYKSSPSQWSGQFPDNFIPNIAPGLTAGYMLYNDEFRQRYEKLMSGWAKIVPPTWFSYDCFLWLSGGSCGMITPASPKLQNLLYHGFVKYHVKGAEVYGTPAWSQTSLASYIKAKMLWNPRLDAVSLQHEWLRRAYGAQAGAAMERLYDTLDHWFAEASSKRLFRAYHANEELFKNLYAPHYAELEKLFLAAKAQPMTDIQKQRLRMMEDNLIILQWRLRNAGHLPADFSTPLTRSNERINDLLFHQPKDRAFDHFPVGWYVSNPPPKAANVRIDPPPAGSTKKSSAILTRGYILLYPTRDREIRLMPAHVDAGSSFLAYRIFEGDKGSLTNPYKTGLFYEGETILFKAKANTPYYFKISQQGVSPASELRYQLSIADAAAAKGAAHDGTLYLQGPSATLYVFAPPSLNLAVSADSADVVLREENKRD
jgi:hypothetical protein